MKRVWTAVVLGLLGASCGDGSRGRTYERNDLQLATGYTAKEACSCLFVMEQSEEFCRAWTKASPDVAGFRVDRDARTVESSALLMWGGRARFVDAKSGCVLE
ncbi:hypothetical protein P2318_33830 [Myxococcaceae bacterium GXIMD 01537]